MKTCTEEVKLNNNEGIPEYVANIAELTNIREKLDSVGNSLYLNLLKSKLSDENSTAVISIFDIFGAHISDFRKTLNNTKSLLNMSANKDSQSIDEQASYVLGEKEKEFKKYFKTEITDCAYVVSQSPRLRKNLEKMADESRINQNYKNAAVLMYAILMAQEYSRDVAIMAKSKHKNAELRKARRFSIPNTLINF
jgi:hypothetical protein